MKLTWKSKEERFNVVNQFEALRQNGSNNMFDFFGVQKEAFDVGLMDFVKYFANNSERYSIFLSNYEEYYKFIDEDVVAEFLELF